MGDDDLNFKDFYNIKIEAHMCDFKVTIVKFCNSLQNYVTLKRTIKSKDLCNLQ